MRTGVTGPMKACRRASCWRRRRDQPLHQAAAAAAAVAVVRACVCVANDGVSRGRQENGTRTPTSRRVSCGLELRLSDATEAG
jgi:hypothetical protein